MPDSLITFFVAITVLTMTPGLDTMIILRNTIRGGAKDGIVSSIGICSGLFIHAFLSAVGISAILLYSSTAFTTLKVIGACYLIWLGFINLKSFWYSSKQKKVETSKEPFHFIRSFREGFMSNVLNPKTIVFYMAFLPQFISPESSALVQSMILAAFHFIIAMIWQGILIYTICSANVFITKESVRKTLDLISGLIMMVFGVKLFMSDK